MLNNRPGMVGPRCVDMSTSYEQPPGPPPGPWKKSRTAVTGRADFGEGNVFHEENQWQLPAPVQSHIDRGLNSQPPTLSGAQHRGIDEETCIPPSNCKSMNTSVCMPWVGRRLERGCDMHLAFEPTSVEQTHSVVEQTSRYAVKQTTVPRTTTTTVLTPTPHHMVTPPPSYTSRPAPHHTVNLVPHCAVQPAPQSTVEPRTHTIKQTPYHTVKPTTRFNFAATPQLHRAVEPVSRFQLNQHNIQL